MTNSTKQTITLTSNHWKQELFVRTTRATWVMGNVSDKIAATDDDRPWRPIPPKDIGAALAENDMELH